MIEHWYLACMIIVTSSFYWYHAVTLTFDLSQGQICCRAGDHNSSTLLVWISIQFTKIFIKEILQCCKFTPKYHKRSSEIKAFVWKWTLMKKLFLWREQKELHWWRDELWIWCLLSMYFCGASKARCHLYVNSTIQHSVPCKGISVCLPH